MTARQYNQSKHARGRTSNIQSWLTSFDFLNNPPPQWIPLNQDLQWFYLSWLKMANHTTYFWLLWSEVDSRVSCTSHCLLARYVNQVIVRVLFESAQFKFINKPCSLFGSEALNWRFQDTLPHMHMHMFPGYQSRKQGEDSLCSNLFTFWHICRRANRNFEQGPSCFMDLFAYGCNHSVPSFLLRSFSTWKCCRNKKKNTYLKLKHTSACFSYVFLSLYTFYKLKTHMFQKADGLLIQRI